MPQPLRTVVPQELRVAKDSKPPRQSANVELAVELTPSRPPRFGERPLRARSGQSRFLFSAKALSVVKRLLVLPVLVRRP